MKVSELFAEIGFKVNEDGLKDFSSKLSGLKKDIDGVAAALKNVQGIKFPKIDISSGSSNIEQKLEKAEQKKQKSVERENRRVISERKKLAREFLGGLKAVSAFTISAMKKTFSIMQTSAGASMMYGDYARLTGGSSADLQRYQALAAATGSGLSREAMYSQLVGLRERYNQILLSGGDTTPFKLLGVTPNQSPAQMMESLLSTYRSSGNKELVLSIMRQLGMSAEGFGRMANATPEQIKMAENLMRLMPKGEQLERLNNLNAELSSLSDAARSLRDRFSAAFLDIDPDIINNVLNSFSSKEMQEAVDDTAKLFYGLYSALKWIVEKLYEVGKWIGERLASLGIIKEKMDEGYERGMKKIIEWRDAKGSLGWLKNIGSGVAATIPFAPELIGRYVGGSEKSYNDNKTVTNNITVASPRDAAILVDNSAMMSFTYGDGLAMGVPK